QQRKAGHTECRAEEGEAKEVICATAFSEKRGAVSRSNLRQRLTFGIFCSQHQLSTINFFVVKRAEKQSQIATAKVDSSRQSGVLVLLGVLFTLILAGLDNTIVSTVMPVALPELGGAHLYAWTFAAYMLAAAVSMPIWGPGSDRWGRRRTYLIGIVAFTVGSGLCAIARTMMEFIGARAIQGIGAGAVATLPF